MIRHLSRSSLAILVLLSTTLATAREWRDTSGRFSESADFAGIRGDRVLLASTDGRRFSIQLAMLSADDRAYATHLAQNDDRPSNPFSDDETPIPGAVPPPSESPIPAGPPPNEFPIPMDAPAPTTPVPGESPIPESAPSPSDPFGPPAAEQPSAQPPGSPQPMDAQPELPTGAYQPAPEARELPTPAPSAEPPRERPRVVPPSTSSPPPALPRSLMEEPQRRRPLVREPIRRPPSQAKRQQPQTFGPPLNLPDQITIRQQDAPGPKAVYHACRALFQLVGGAGTARYSDSHCGSRSLALLTYADENADFYFYWPLYGDPDTKMWAFAKTQYGCQYRVWRFSDAAGHWLKYDSATMERAR